MQKLLRYVLITLLIAPLVSFAETDYVSMDVLKAIQNGKDTKDQIKVLRVKDSVVLPDDSIAIDDLDGVTATAAELNAADVSASAATAAPGFLYSLTAVKSFSAASPLYTNESFGITIPDNAIVIAGIIDIPVALISTSDDGTLDIHLRGGANVLGTIDADTIAAVYTNSTDLRFDDAGTWLKTTSNTVVEYTTATHVVTNGTIGLTLMYLMGR